MTRIKALNDFSEYSESSDSDYQVTREAEEEELNELYINALKYASKGDFLKAINLLQQLKNELEKDNPKVKDIFLLKRLKYLTYKNLGLFKNDLNYILDALEFDNSDINLWITAGRKSKEKSNYLLSKHCFETAYNFNQSNYIVIENLIDLHFITNNLYRCVSICLQALTIDPDYLKAKILINECIRLMPPILKDINPEFMCHISRQFGGHNYDLENERTIMLSKKILKPLNSLKLQQLNSKSEANNDNGNCSIKRKQLSLYWNKLEHSSFEKIGLKIKNIYDLIQKNHFNICTPIVFDFNQNEVNKGNELNQNNHDVIKNENDDSLINEEKIKKSPNDSKEQKTNEKLLLYEYTDKRRSSRVKTKSKNSDFEDDQCIFYDLINLLPEKFKNESTKAIVNIDAEYISSNSASINENEFNTVSKTIETEAVETFLQKFKSDPNKKMNIFELITFYLIEISSIKNIIIPRIFLILYKIYREQNQLPCGTLCEIGKDINVELILVCLTANEVEYNKQETLFLKQISSKLFFHLDSETYRKFLVRLFVLCGSKEFNTDFLHYALDFSMPNSKYFKLFQIGQKTSNYCESKKDPEEILASNNLKINSQYINTLIDIQNMSISKSFNNQNYSEIIRLFFIKSENDLTDYEKKQLYEAIIKTELWQKGVDFFENWLHFDDDCLETILYCVAEKKAHLSPKLVKKIVKRAAEGHSIHPWLILYWCLITENVDNQSLVKFFSLGHNILGKRGICTEHDGEFLLRAQKHFIESDPDDEIIMCFSCLFNFPPRKNLQLQDYHTSPHIDLKWIHCTDIYEYFAPEQMPEFDSHARQSGITLETKEFFIKILDLVPEDEKPKQTTVIIDYIKHGESLSIQENQKINSITSTIYYLLADHYFKAKDFPKAKHFYINDLSLNVNRFDSWAGLALSTNYELDQMLIEGTNTNSQKFHQTAFSTMQCFERALQLQPDNYKLWIEFGILCYNIASNWSRLMKRSQIFGTKVETTNKFYKYEDILEKAKHCFERVNDSDIYNEESWLSYYMLGKVSEKSNSDLLTILKYYEWSYLNLYLDGASYPKKISYYSPPYLSIESLEIHYRIHSCVLKYLLNNRRFTARMLRQLKFFLIKVNKSPFVLRNSGSIYQTSKKQNGSKNLNGDKSTICEDEQQVTDLINDILLWISDRDVKFDVNRARNELISMCISGIKKCLSRYSAHYKSYYRLAHYYTSQDSYTAKSILCGGIQNKLNSLLCFEIDPEKPNSNPGYISGLFAERKPSNLYNGIWRIPVDEIERAGNFNFHMFRCTNLLITVCALTEDYNLLSSIAIQLYKTPDHDKKYVNHSERILLSKKAFDKCFQILESKILNYNVLANRERHIIEEIQIIAQNMIKHNVFPNETLQKCNYINETLIPQCKKNYEL